MGEGCQDRQDEAPGTDLKSGRGFPVRLGFLALEEVGLEEGASSPHLDVRPSITRLDSNRGRMSL
jgi:hypothetical protein